MTPKVPQPSLTERRARLRELLKRDDATFRQYHEVLTGATEDERKGLARTLSIKKLIDRYSCEGTTEQRQCASTRRLHWAEPSNTWVLSS